MKTRFDFLIQGGRGPFEFEFRLQSSARAIGIRGPSGCGKSTLMRTLAGLKRDMEGYFKFNEMTLQDSQRKLFIPPWKRKFGYVPQESVLIPTDTVEENLKMSGANFERLHEWADLLEIQPLLQRRPRLLSGGEKQRVALARAILSQPELYLLDEPFSALDSALKKKVLSLFSDHCEKLKTPLILVSHDERDFEPFVEEVVFIKDGLGLYRNEISSISRSVE